MRIKILLFLCVTILIAGGMYVYYKAIPPKGKATGTIERPAAVLKEIDKVFRLADINNDKLAEIILLKKYSDKTGKIFILDIKGNQFNGWPKDGNYSAVGCVNNDGYKEIVDIIDNKIYVYDQFGTQLPGFPLALDKKPTTPPILADLDSNGALEIICGNNMPMPVINVVTGNGYFMEGWQNKIVMPSAKSEYPFSLSVGDINNDKELEIVALASDRIFVFNNRGECISRSLVLGLQGSAVPQLNLADFNLDKALEIVLVYGNEVSVRNVDNELFKIKMQNNILSEIMGDLNGDNLPEIILTMPDQKICIYDNKGKLISGWPKDKIIGSPVVGDINSDGINEVIAIAKPFDEYEITAYDLNGKPVSNWPINLDYTVNSTLALSDIDDDRLIEIVFADTEDNIRIIKTCGIVSKGSWAEPAGNIYNNGVWKPEYMLIDMERGINNKNEVLESASKIIPEFIKPEFRLLIYGKDLAPSAIPKMPVKELNNEVIINAEMEKLKKENPNITYNIISSEFNSDGLLIKYNYTRYGQGININRMSREIFYDETKKEIGFSEYGLDTGVMFIQYREAAVDQNGNRNVFFDRTKNMSGMNVENALSMLKNEAKQYLDQAIIYRNSEILRDSQGREIGYAEYYKAASGRVVYDEYFTDSSGKRNIWFMNGVFQTGALEQTIAMLKNTAKSASPEFEKLKKENPKLTYTIMCPEFNNSGLLVKYRYLRYGSGININNMNREILYDAAKKETGFSEYGLARALMFIQYREAVVDQNGNRNVFFDRTRRLSGTTVENALNMLKNEARQYLDQAVIYRNSEILRDSQGREIGYAEYYKAASGRVVYSESLTDSAGNRKGWFAHNVFQTGTLEQAIIQLKNMARLMMPEFLGLQRENPNLTYNLFEPRLNEKGVLISYSYRKPNFDYVHREIIYNSGGNRIGFNEYGIIHGYLSIQYKEALIDRNGNIQVWFDETMRLAGATVEKVLAVLKNKAKTVLTNKEIDKLKRMDPSLIYIISDPQIIEGRLAGYKCQVTNSIGTINRMIRCEIYYDMNGREIGWGEFGKIEDGRIQYREAVTNPDGGRNIWFAYAINQQGTVQKTEDLLRKMARALELETKKLKEEAPYLEYHIMMPKFNDKGILTGYRYMKIGRGARQEMTREIFYDANWKETGFGEWGRVGR